MRVRTITRYIWDAPEIPSDTEVIRETKVAESSHHKFISITLISGQTLFPNRPYRGKWDKIERSSAATPIDLTIDESDTDMRDVSSSLAENSTEAGNTSDAEPSDSPSPRSRRPLSTASNLSSNSMNPEPAISSSLSAASHNRFTVPSDDSSSNDEESDSECLADPFTEGATVQIKDEEDESVSSPSQPLEFINYRTGGHRPSRETNEAIRNTIIKQSKLNKDPKGGFVYAIHCPHDPSSYLKIGKTHKVPETRLKEWSKDCCIHLVPVPDPSPASSSPCGKDAFLSYGLVESIIQQEFHNQRKRHVCKRHKHKHNEWFDISSETAYHSINRWRTWLVVEQPFEKSTGKLKPYWQWKVDNLNKNYSTLDWDVWTQPSYWDWWEYKCDDYPRLVLLLNHMRRKDLHFCVMGCFVSCLGYFLYNGPEWKWCFFVLSLLAV
ncbi:hypothetical protein CJF32_00009153 [Rutstroemia sp. NJR-2017a WRK4]|nr:hypothetical protein CJF32_00009153 [Rutstroemia sp. NJR-2017a WRK4]